MPMPWRRWVAGRQTHARHCCGVQMVDVDSRVWLSRWQWGSGVSVTTQAVLRRLLLVYEQNYLSTGTMPTT